MGSAPQFLRAALHRGRRLSLVFWCGCPPSSSSAAAAPPSRVARVELAREQADPTVAALLLAEEEAPAEVEAWTQAAIDVLQQRISFAVLRGHTGPVVDVALSPDGSRALTASEDGTARIWRTDARGEAVVLHGDAEGLRTASFSPDGRQTGPHGLEERRRPGVEGRRSG